MLDMWVIFFLLNFFKKCVRAEWQTRRTPTLNPHSNNLADIHRQKCLCWNFRFVKPYGSPRLSGTIVRREAHAQVAEHWRWYQLQTQMQPHAFVH